MDIFSSALLLYMSLFVSAENATFNKVDLNNLYYYDENRIKQGIIFNNSIFVPKNEKSVEIIANLNERFEFNKNRNGYVVHFKTTHDAINFVNLLNFHNLPMYPIYLVNNNLVIYDQSYPKNVVLLVKVNNFVNSDLLLNHLEDDWKFEVLDLKVLNNFAYIVVLKNNTYNRLLLANMLSEDSVWFEWVQPSFSPLYGNISVSLYLENTAASNLGCLRNLVLDITYYNQNIVIKDDMVPIMGKDIYVQPLMMDKFFEIYPHSVIRTEFPNRNNIKVIYPFRHLDNNLFQDNSWTVPFNIRYLLNNNPEIYSVDSYFYKISSLIKFTNINDIRQPNLYSNNITLHSIQSVFLINWFDKINFRSIAILCFSIVGFIIIVYTLYYIMLSYYTSFSKLEKVNFWKQLKDEVDSISIENWLISYRNIYKMLPYESYSCVVGMDEVYDELNKLFQYKPNPNITKLKSDLYRIFPRLKNFK